MQMRFVGRVLLSVLLHGSALATSIVVQVDPSRILVAADTLGSKLDPGATSRNEAECKIVPFEGSAFAVAGNMDYLRNRLDDPVASWDSRSDAHDAYTEQRGDLVAASDDWATRAERHYTSFYLANPARVTELAKTNDQNVLLVGVFAGFQGGKALLLMRIVYLDEHFPPAIRDRQVSLSERKLPYSTNGITQELVEGNSDRRRATDAAWTKKSRSIPPSRQTVRHIEFLIQATAQYDDTVGTRVDIVQITFGHKPVWLQNLTCPAK